MKTAAADSGVSSVFLCYAFAMFCERDVFEAHHRETGESCDYVAMRAEAGAAAGLADTFDATAFHFEDSTPWVGDLGGFDGGGFDGGCGGD